MLEIVGNTSRGALSSLLIAKSYIRPSPLPTEHRLQDTILSTLLYGTNRLDTMSLLIPALGIDRHISISTHIPQYDFRQG
jgi:hypothetical protein